MRVALAASAAILTALSLGGPANGSSSGTPPYVILPVVMGVLLVVQAGAIRVARRGSAG